MLNIFQKSTRSTFAFLDLLAIPILYVLTASYTVDSCKEDCATYVQLPAFLSLVSIFVALIFFINCIVGIVKNKTTFPKANAIFLGFALVLVIVEFLIIRFNVF